jgi:hypothetical protein
MQWLRIGRFRLEEGSKLAAKEARAKRGTASQTSGEVDQERRGEGAERKGRKEEDFQKV